MKPTLVLFTPPNDYKRYENGSITDHVQSADRSLTAQEVELLRNDPAAFFAGADEPEAA